MDLDDLFAKNPGDPLVLLTRQDLDPLSLKNLRCAGLFWSRKSPEFRKS